MFKGSIVALVTPMTDDGSIDFSALANLIDYHINSGTHGIVTMGTTAESATLSFDEQQKVIRFVCEKVSKRIPVFAGNGTNNTLESVHRTQILDTFDIDGFLTVVPYYNKPSQKGMIAHFTAVARATDKPVLLYNVPGRTVVDLLPETVAELAKITNIIGIKETTGQMERLEQLKQACGQDFICLSGDDVSAFEFLQKGGDGVISVTANVAAKEMADLCHCALDGDFAQAKIINNTLDLLHQRLFVEPNPVPTKWVLQQLGLISTANVRLPLLCLEPIHNNAVKEAMKVARLIS
jgi:4-hydroxy-tetrahydrodipicolinate synthase